MNAKTVELARYHCLVCMPVVIGAVSGYIQVHDAAGIGVICAIEEQQLQTRDGAGEEA
jgi:hypothetical protein